MLTATDNKKAQVLAEAVSTSSSWNSMHHSSYLAWVRNEGTHRTKSVGYKCWNTELVASMNHVSVPHWLSLDENVENDLHSVWEQMQDFLVEFRTDVQGK